MVLTIDAVSSFASYVHDPSVSPPKTVMNNTTGNGILVLDAQTPNERLNECLTGTHLDDFRLILRNLGFGGDDDSKLSYKKAIVNAWRDTQIKIVLRSGTGVVTSFGTPPEERVPVVISTLAPVLRSLAGSEFPDPLRPITYGRYFASASMRLEGSSNSVRLSDPEPEVALTRLENSGGDALGLTINEFFCSDGRVRYDPWRDQMNLACAGGEMALEEVSGDVVRGMLNPSCVPMTSHDSTSQFLA